MGALGKILLEEPGYYSMRALAEIYDATGMS